MTSIPLKSVIISLAIFALAVGCGGGSSDIEPDPAAEDVLEEYRMISNSIFDRSDQYCIVRSNVDAAGVAWKSVAEFDEGGVVSWRLEECLTGEDGRYRCAAETGEGAVESQRIISFEDTIQQCEEIVAKDRDEWRVSFDVSSRGTILTCRARKRGCEGSGCTEDMSLRRLSAGSCDGDRADLMWNGYGPEVSWVGHGDAIEKLVTSLQKVRELDAAGSRYCTGGSASSWTGFSSEWAAQFEGARLVRWKQKHCGRGLFSCERDKGRGYPAPDQIVYAQQTHHQCLNSVIVLPPEENRVNVTYNDDGYLQGCSYWPDGCADDCTFGPDMGTFERGSCDL